MAREVEGVLHEGVSARIVARLAKTCVVPGIQTVLKEIAADEGKHSAHAWDVVQWCWQEGGMSVESALRGAVLSFGGSTRSHSSMDTAADGTLEPFGIPGVKMVAEESLKARRELVLRVEHLFQSAKAA